MFFSDTRWRLVKWMTLQATDFSDWLLRNRKWSLTAADYRSMPSNTAGNKLITYMDSVKITFKPNLVRHDLKHVLSGYQMTTPHELRIQAFLLGNRSSNVFSVIYLLVCLPFVPEFLGQLKRDFIRGKKAVCMKSVNLESFVYHDLEQTRCRFKIEPLDEKELLSNRF